MLGVFALIFAAGCGVPQPESTYVTMDDGVQLAVDVWLPPDLPEGTTVPAVMQLGRYWRDYALPEFLPPFVGKYLTDGGWLNAAGYAAVMVDVRGTGASFGVSTAPWAPREVADFGALVDWVVAQPWSNGKVGGIGVSYAGVTADWLGAVGHPAVAAVLPTYSYSDIYLDVSHPGGIFNEHFVAAWSEVTARMDRNDITFLDVVVAANPRSWLAVFADVIAAALLGVRPITGAGNALADAIAQHADNPTVFHAARRIEYRDDLFETVAVNDISPLLGPATTERSAAIQRVVGWQDAGTARGALSAFNTLDTPYHVVVIAPQTHTGNYRCDPYDFNTPPALERQQVIDAIWQAVPLFDTFLRTDSAGARRREVRYYTYVERTWKTTNIWPPAGFTTQRWYFGPDGTLSREAPATAAGEDMYVVDFDATTGPDNRWFSGLSGVPIVYPDRAGQDARLLVYDSPPLDQDYELTGHPVVSLQVISDRTDGAFYVYLEDVLPDGRVVYLTEGQLRAVHRRGSLSTFKTAGPSGVVADAAGGRLRPVPHFRAGRRAAAGPGRGGRNHVRPAADLDGAAQGPPAAGGRRRARPGHLHALPGDGGANAAVPAERDARELDRRPAEAPWRSRPTARAPADLHPAGHRPMPDGGAGRHARAAIGVAAVPARTRTPRYGRTPSTLTMSRTSSPTGPISLVMPKSLRLISNTVSQPQRNSPRIPVPLPVRSIFTVNGLVTPWSVRSPATSSVVSPTFLTLRLLKVMRGNCSASKKSGDFRCLSRSALAVSTLATLTCTSNDPRAGSASSSTKVPAISLKRP